MPFVAASNSSTPTEHLPAWKRLGLKLKLAKEAVQDVGISAAVPTAKRIKFLQDNPSSRSEAQSLPLNTRPALNINAREARSQNRRIEKLNGLVDLDSTVGTSETSKPNDPTTGRTEDQQQSRAWHKSKRDSRSPHMNRERDSSTKGQKSTLPAQGFENFEKATVNTEVKESGTPSLKVRKSVVFTPDTKIEDGSSARDLFDAWAARQNYENYDAGPASEWWEPSTAVVEEKSHNEDRQSKAAKKAKRNTHHNSGSQAVSSANALGTSTKERPTYLSYLEQYHVDRDRWKFNKSSQISLLKNTFNLYLIPQVHDEALAAYVSGLQGEAARFRLCSAAQRIVDETHDTSNSADSAGHQETSTTTPPEPRDPTTPVAADTAISTDGSSKGEPDQQGAEARIRQLRRERALKILQALGPEEATNATSSYSDTTNPEESNARTVSGGKGTTSNMARIKLDRPEASSGQAEKVTRKRKRRTEVSPDVSSSSSSDGDGDGDGDGDDSVRGKGKTDQDISTSSGLADKDHEDASSSLSEVSSTLSSSSSDSSAGSDSESLSDGFQDNVT